MARANYDHIFKEVAEEYGVPPKVVRLMYNQAWMFARSKLKEIELKEDLTWEEFDKMRTSFTFSRLGKLYIDFEKIENNRKVKKWLKEKREQDAKDKEDKADVHGDSDDNG